MQGALKVIVVEDEALLLMQLESFLENAGHVVVGDAMSLQEALTVSAGVEADLALVDIHLADGPTGIEVGRFFAEHTTMAVVFMTANAKRIPDDFSGAIGVIAKPYTQAGLSSALKYIVGAVHNPPPSDELPRSLVLAPAYARKWSALQENCDGLKLPL